MTILAAYRCRYEFRIGGTLQAEGQGNAGSGRSVKEILQLPRNHLELVLFYFQHHLPEAAVADSGVLDSQVVSKEFRQSEKQWLMAFESPWDESAQRYLHPSIDQLGADLASLKVDFELRRIPIGTESEHSCERRNLWGLSTTDTCLDFSSLPGTPYEQASTKLLVAADIQRTIGRIRLPEGPQSGSLLKDVMRASSYAAGEQYRVQCLNVYASLKEASDSLYKLLCWSIEPVTPGPLHIELVERPA